MTRILLLSNGHGEDLSGALLGEKLKKMGHIVNALPLVGTGYSYSKANISIIGETKQFSTGGLGYTSIRGRLTELFQGQLIYLLKHLFNLIRRKPNYELIIVIGDVVPILAAWLTKLPFVVYLVAYSSHYEGQLKLPWPCKRCLKSARCIGIFGRDQLTAQDLTLQLKRPVQFVGNPFMDPIFTNQERLPQCTQRLGILPGSRNPELQRNILMILAVIELLPQQFNSHKSITMDIALMHTLDNKKLQELTRKQGWILAGNKLIRGDLVINIHRNSFAKVILSSDLILSMAGTAAEQAVGVAKPVLQLKGKGPQFTNAFAEAQRRLLGPTVFCANGRPGDFQNLSQTAELIFSLIQRSKKDPLLKQDCKEQAQKRLGTAEGSILMARMTTNFFNQYKNSF